MGELRVIPLPGIPEVRPGDDLAALIGDAVERAEGLEEGDVLVVAQKVVSKAEGRVVALSGVEPSAEAEQLATELERDPAVMQLVLAESREVLRAERTALICETRHGFVCANAGVDTSNVGEGQAALLPLDPDASARRIRGELRAAPACGRSTTGADATTPPDGHWGRR